MIPGPDQIIACPHCSALAKHGTLMSGNTMGAHGWTDGKQIAPMLPRPPAVVLCQQCAQCYWLADAAKIGTVDLWGDRSPQTDPSWTNAPYVQEPGETEYYQALQGDLAANPKEERTLRILAWWRRNSAFRDIPQGTIDDAAIVTGATRDNLNALVELLNDGQADNRLMKAEVLRELGAFEAAIAELDRVTTAEYAKAVLQLRALCEARDVCVRELEF